MRLWNGSRRNSTACTPGWAAPRQPPKRLLVHDAGQPLFDEVVWAANEKGLLLDELFSVDGILIEAAASLKSFQLKEALPPPADDDPSNPSVDFRGECRYNETHANTTDPDGEPPRLADGLHGQPSD